MTESSRRQHAGATAVGSGILLSRVTGLLRDVTFAAFLGTGLLADAYWAALRIPNIIRNLLGEGTLSASFVPVYSDLLANPEKSATSPTRLAQSVLAAVLSVALLLSGVGVVAAPWLTRIVAPGFDTAATDLTISLVRILFPMAGVFIVGGWCLGILNSHRRFFLPYVAPVAWNLSQIAGLLLAWRLGAESLVHVLAWSALAGALLQLAVQLPATRRLTGTLRPRWRDSPPETSRVIRNALPVVSSQGIYQVSSLVEVTVASIVGLGAVSALGYSQRLIYLPISLFGASIAIAALPEMSRETRIEAVRARIVNGFFQILFFVLPAAVVFILFGDLIVRVLLQRRAFGEESTAIVSTVLLVYALGLVASSSNKLFASGFHALRDTSTPMRVALVAVSTGMVVGVVSALAMKAAGYGAMSAAGIAAGGVFGAWLNLMLLWRRLGRRLGGLLNPATRRALAKLTAGCLAAAAAAWPVRMWLEAAVGVAGTLPALAVLTAALSAGAIPYLLIVRRPPRPAPMPGDSA
ncbi:MAG: murein biosynthesis integral membrane protein MurJ [Gemmatimonadota bacterium]